MKIKQVNVQNIYDTNLDGKISIITDSYDIVYILVMKMKILCLK